MKRCFLFALCCLMLLSVLSVSAFAAESVDLDRKGSISVTMTYGGEAVPGGSLTLYHVADAYVERGATYGYRYTENYAGCTVSLEKLDSSDTARALAEYTLEEEIAGTKLVINNKGYVDFPNLTPGLYLLIQEDAAEGFESVVPFLVSVPGQENGSYVYDVDASPKLALEPAPTEPPTEPEPTEPEPTEPEPTEPEPTDPPKLPQTGMNQWPVPLLAMGGLLLVTLGAVLCISGKKKNHEG